MSLFIGNIANAVSQKELEETFGKYGKCDINYKGAYAFAEYSSEKDADVAKIELQNKEICGRVLNIEWSKKSKNYEKYQYAMYIAWNNSFDLKFEILNVGNEAPTKLCDIITIYPQTLINVKVITLSEFKSKYQIKGEKEGEDDFFSQLLL